jgi:hypothetical protein
MAKGGKRNFLGSPRSYEKKGSGAGLGGAPAARSISSKPGAYKGKVSPKLSMPRPKGVEA